MNRRFHLLRVIALLACARSAFAAHNIPNVSLEVTAEAVQPANCPIILTITVRNTGKTPLRYWWSGPSDCPDARNFSAAIVAQNSQTTSRQALTNGQTPEASGRLREVFSGRFVSFQAAMPPMPPGSYSIEIRSDADGKDWPAMKTGGSISIQVNSDQDLLAARDSRILTGVRANDPFAQYVASTWPRRPVKDALAEDLKGNNVVAADRAAEGLWFGAQPPADDGAIVADAIIHHLKEPTDGCDLGLMDKLLKAGPQPLSNEVRLAASRLTQARNDGHVRLVAMDALNRHTQGPKEVWIPNHSQLANGGRETDPVRVARHDAAVEMLKSRDPSDREFACSALAEYPESEVAVNLLRKAVFDTAADVRSAARVALQCVENYRRLNNELPFPSTQP